MKFVSTALSQREESVAVWVFTHFPYTDLKKKTKNETNNKEEVMRYTEDDGSI